ncbi:MAG: hypothetical protein RID91_16140 [Azospirillaceae bacterium]
MLRSLAILMAVVTACGAQAAMADDVFDRQCPEGQAADQYEYWQWIENNAVRTADEYAMARNPSAAFVDPKIDASFQVAGDHAGEYLVMLVEDGAFGTAFAMLKPNFDFCGDPARLDASRSDLFEVVVAKLDGREF